MSDLISRQAAIDAVNGMPDCPNGFSGTYDKAAIIGILEDVPSVHPDFDAYCDRLWKLAYERGKRDAQPQRMRGKWIRAEYQREEDIINGNYMFVCSNCSHVDFHAKTVEVPYCWYCGADMRGDSNG